FPVAAYQFRVVELVALRRVAARPAAQRLPANRAVRASRSAAARGGVVAGRQPLPLTVLYRSKDGQMSRVFTNRSQLVCLRRSFVVHIQTSFPQAQVVSHPGLLARSLRGLRAQLEV